MNDSRRQSAVEAGHEQRMRDPELRYRRLFETVQVGILIIDARTGKVDDVNPYLIAMLGYSRAEFLYKKLWELGAFQDVDAGRQAFMRLQKEDHVRYEDLLLHAKDGRLVPVEFVSNVYAVGGKDIIQCNIRDITKRMQARQAAAESESKLRSLFAGMTDIIIIYDSDGRYMEIGPTDPVDLVRPADELLGKTISEVFPADDAQFFLEHIREVLKTGEPRDLDYSLHLREQVLWFSARVSRFSSDRVIWVARDITERKRVEQELQKSEEQFRSLFDNMLDGYSHCRMVFEDGRPTDFVYLYVNTAFETLTGLKNVEGRLVSEVIPGIQESNPELFEIYGRVAFTGNPEKFETYVSELENWFSVSVYCPKPGEFVTVFDNTSRRKRAESALALESQRFQQMVNANIVGIIIAAADGRVLFANDYYLDILGVTRQDFIEGRVDWRKFTPPEWLPLDERALRELRERGVCTPYEKEYLRADGTRVPVYLADAILPGADEQIVAFVLDLTERKQADSLQQAVYRIAVAAEQSTDLDELYPQIHDIISSVMPAENFYIALYDEERNLLRFPYSRDTVDDPFPNELQAGKGLTAYVLKTGRSLLCTQAVHNELERQGAVVLVGEPSAIWLGAPLIVEGKTIGAVVVQHYSDPDAYGEREQHVLEFVSSQIAIAIRRKQGEAEIRSLSRFPEENPEPVLRISGEGVLLYANPRSEPLLRSWNCQVGMRLPDPVLEKIRPVLEGGSPVRVESNAADRVFSLLFWPIAGLGYINVYGRDITEARQAEQQLRYDAVLLANVNDAIIGSDAQYRLTAWNAAAEALYGWTAEEALGEKGIGILRTEWPGVDADAMRRTIAENGQWRGEASQVRKDGTRIPVEVSSMVLRDEGGEISGYVSAIRDITERKQTENRIRQQVERLAALRSVDRAIIGSFDMRVILRELLQNATSQLGVDAADILVLNAPESMLEYAAGLGFRTVALQHTKLRLGQSLAGTAALERRIVQVRDLHASRTDLSLSPEFDSEEFHAYVGVPLISKGKVLGVLEVFHRRPLEPDQEWLDFLDILSELAAIAIDNTRMFEHLERSNFSLALAYDATLTGWSRALDLRDKDTEGHTQRVTALSIELARALGVGEEELQNIRRGALLHDIGKMGVPDSILLKPGPLNDEEWEIMKKHPAVAYELISPIEYLRPALDIPYCHHEKWDGSGYPRGLKAAQIPLSARIFAVIDVWDALISDRPYRAAWTKEKALAHIRSASGQHFEPRVVDAFLRMVEQDEWRS